jgi:flagellar L-ring protein precursor FlgH
VSDLQNWILAGAALLALSACGTAPSTHISQPLSARPVDALSAARTNNGAIFQSGINQHPLFEDVRARNVGDTLTIAILENSSAVEKNGSDANHASTVSSNLPSASVNAKHVLDGLNISANSANKLATTGDSSGSNFLTGAITATVIDVLPNGNLVVSGEKLVSINQVDEYIRLSGVVNPANVQSGNTVLSTQVADARIEYKGGNANIDKAAVMSMLSRFFLSAMPF